MNGSTNEPSVLLWRWSWLAHVFDEDDIRIHGKSPRRWVIDAAKLTYLCDVWRLMKGNRVRRVMHDVNSQEVWGLYQVWYIPKLRNGESGSESGFASGFESAYWRSLTVRQLKTLSTSFRQLYLCNGESDFGAVNAPGVRKDFFHLTLMPNFVRFFFYEISEGHF